MGSETKLAYASANDLNKQTRLRLPQTPPFSHSDMSTTTGELLSQAIAQRGSNTRKAEDLFKQVLNVKVGQSFWRI